jgi:phage/plasmid-associated DNA primase
MCKRSGGKFNDSATTSRIYDVYRAWCYDNNNGFAKTAKEFRETLAAHLVCTFKEMTVHTNKGTYYKNLTLTIEAKEQYKKAYGYDSTEFLA